MLVKFYVIYVACCLPLSTAAPWPIQDPQSFAHVEFLSICIINYCQPSFAFPPLCRDFYRLAIATSKDHWVPRMLFALLIS